MRAFASKAVIILALLILASVANAAGEGAFHKAKTPPELAVDNILNIAQNDGEIAWFAVDAPWRDKDKDRNFAPYFTQALRQAWIKAETEAVAKNCQGKYIDGDDCGIAIQPITCAQDSSEAGYIYKTIASSSDSAVVAYRWPQFPDVIATYKMVKQGGKWLMDGVACGVEPSFNYK